MRYIPTYIHTGGGEGDISPISGGISGGGGGGINGDNEIVTREGFPD